MIATVMYIIIYDIICNSYHFSLHPKRPTCQHLPVFHTPSKKKTQYRSPRLRELQMLSGLVCASGEPSPLIPSHCRGRCIARRGSVHHRRPVSTASPGAVMLHVQIHGFVASSNDSNIFRFYQILKQATGSGDV